MIITPAIVAAGCGAVPSRATLFAPLMQLACEHYQISAPLDVAAFLAQTGHESQGMLFTKELWGPTAAQRAYEPPSQKASDLGNTQPGDGERFCGRGLIQITGRRNYTLAAIGLDLDLLNHPELLEQPANAAMSAGWFWFNNKLSAIATAGNFVTLTRRINGGTNGLADRQALYGAAQKALGMA
ncbi:glycoside hydrolase family 19 protein [Paraburkholderia bryophila]|uniref:glycoside hydrolase family 19 protein n=1 Tax=Paraburkholderia bryophila TaxID=420952 RepID=UPI00234A69E1|nr:glycoside hydrolase family 19 protein [Paraburkholderia bryophila]WCM21343.1 glycoside hydrolase family 19 protein [Paraburkholderia bryophila]